MVVQGELKASEGAVFRWHDEAVACGDGDIRQEEEGWDEAEHFGV